MEIISLNNTGNTVIFRKLTLGTHLQTVSFVETDFTGQMEINVAL
jgi:hypothetical protein